MSLNWQQATSCTNNVQEIETLHGCLECHEMARHHLHMSITQRGDAVMSASDYLRVHNTRLADMNALPRALLCRYLATCPPVVRHQLLMRLCERQTSIL